MARSIIVNADDFGLSEGVNRGIIECFERGILTSASLMVRWPAAAAAADYARKNPKLSVGLHLDLGEWIQRNGEWEALYQVVDTNDGEAVSREIEQQVDEFRKLVGRDPSHLDSHQHVHRNEPVHSKMNKFARRLRVSLRQCNRKIGYCGDFYGQGAENEHLSDALTVENFCRIVDSLPDGITELGCHPGYGDGLATPYRAERAEEVRVLCDPAVREYLAQRGVSLRSFHDFQS